MFPSPAGGSFTVELAVNRAYTTLGYDGSRIADFGDGQDHPGMGVTAAGEEPQCISEVNSKSQISWTG